MSNKKLVKVIVIIFALIVISVAVILILKKEIKPDPIDIQCGFACESNQRTAFCFVEINVNDELTTTCDELSKNPLYAEHNVETCPIVSCELTPQELDKTCVTGLNSTWVTPTTEGTCPPQENKFVRKRNPSDKPQVLGQICCFYYD